MTKPRDFQIGDRVAFNLFGSKHERQGTVTRVTRTGVWVKLDGWDRSARISDPALRKVEG